jgi:hypothetical protein
LTNDDFRLFSSCLHLLPQSKGKFVMFWNLSFSKKTIFEKEKKNSQLVVFYVLKNLRLIFLLVMEKV